jgi:hypothetical protein
LIEPARLCIALGPLAVYFVLLGVVNLARRPVVITGSRDLLALGLALSGFAVIGPIELLTSTTLVIALGPIYWALVLALYASGWLLLTMYVRPRLVVYNVREEELAAALEQAAREVDAQAGWAGQTLLLPAWQTQVALEPFSPLGNVSVVSVGEGPGPAFWRQLELALRRRLDETPVAPNRYGLAMVILAAVMFVAMFYQWASGPRVVTRALLDMLWAG